MNQDERRFDFHGLGLALKQAREEKGWTQAYVAELVGKTDRTIMNIENKGQRPSFNLFFKLVTLFDISVDQFFYTEGQRGENSCRKHIDVLLSSMNEKELVVMEATAEGLKKARETEVQEVCTSSSTAPCPSWATSPATRAASCPSSSTAWPGRSTSSTERKGNRRHESACSVTTRNANSPKGAGPRQQPRPSVMSPPAPAS